MSKYLLQKIENLNHSKEQRQNFARVIKAQPTLMPEFMNICLNTNATYSSKATWALEYICRDDLSMLFPVMDQFITLTQCVTKHPSVRPVARICELICLAFYKDKRNSIGEWVWESHRKSITECCFHWMITEQKVAAKAYSMIALYYLGTEFDWIHEELKIILDRNYAIESAAYKARSRMVFKMIAKNSI